jgi:hypothetical protein
MLCPVVSIACRFAVRAETPMDSMLTGFASRYTLSYIGH